MKVRVLYTAVIYGYPLWITQQRFCSRLQWILCMQLCCVHKKRK